MILICVPNKNYASASQITAMISFQGERNKPGVPCFSNGYRTRIFRRGLAEKGQCSLPVPQSTRKLIKSKRKFYSK